MNCAAAQPQSDCRAITVTNNGVCRDMKGKDCSKEAFENSPKPCGGPDPQYTSEAEEAHIKGTVQLSFSLSTDGCAANIRVLRGLGYGLDEAAVHALERWRWQKPKKSVNNATAEFSFDSQYASTKAPITPKCSEGHSDSPGQRK